MRHKESDLQIACVRWFHFQHGDKVLFAIPNGGNRDVITGAIMKREGVLAGVADLFLCFASNNYNGMFIEMKTQDGRQSQSQMTFQRKVEAAGYKYVICRSFEEFYNEIENYLKNER